MDRVPINPQRLVADAALLEALIDQGEKTVEVIGMFVDTLHTLRVPATPAPAPAVVDEPQGARVFDTSPAALENYDAEQLVELRKDHTAVKHDVETCPICAVLRRRLGSL